MPVPPPTAAARLPIHCSLGEPNLSGQCRPEMEARRGTGNDALPSRRPCRARTDRGGRLARLPAAAARATDLLPGSERGIRAPDRASMECARLHSSATNSEPGPPAAGHSVRARRSDDVPAPARLKARCRPSSNWKPNSDPRTTGLRSRQRIDLRTSTSFFARSFVRWRRSATTVRLRTQWTIRDFTWNHDGLSRPITVQGNGLKRQRSSSRRCLPTARTNGCKRPVAIARALRLWSPVDGK